MITENAVSKDTASEQEKEELINKILEVLTSGSDEECSICLDSLKHPVITHCAHVFCRACIEEVIRGAQVCKEVFNALILELHSLSQWCILIYKILIVSSKFT